MRDEYYFPSVLVDVINFLCGLHNNGQLAIPNCLTFREANVLIAGQHIKVMDIVSSVFQYLTVLRVVD